LKRAAAPLVGACVLCALALAAVPWRGDVLSRPRTPFDRSAARPVAPGFALLRDAAPLIPDGASVVARTKPSDPIQETYFHRFAVALLPGRRVLPTALYASPVPSRIWADAEYLVLIGPKPSRPPGRLLLQTAEGSLWRRGPE